MNPLKSVAGRAKVRLNRFRSRRVVRKVSELRERNAGSEFRDGVQVTLILQFFNKRSNIPDLVQMLRSADAQEVIVCDDGSVDGSTIEWMQHLTRPNDFVLRSNDIFEVRTYDRCISMARGEYVVLLQDDDVAYDSSGRWLKRGLDIFSHDPRIAIVGGRSGQDMVPARGGGFDLADSGRPFNQHGYRYVAAVNRAPWIMRKELYHALGGIDQTFAPFQHDDADMCVRAWLNGYRVAHYDAEFVRDIGTGGMRLFNEHGGDYSSSDKWRKAVKNWETLQSRYGASIGDINALVQAAAGTSV